MIFSTVKNIKSLSARLIFSNLCPGTLNGCMWPVSFLENTKLNTANLSP